MRDVEAINRLMSERNFAKLCMNEAAERGDIVEAKRYAQIALDLGNQILQEFGK